MADAPVGFAGTLTGLYGNSSVSDDGGDANRHGNEERDVMSVLHGSEIARIQPG